MTEPKLPDEPTPDLMLYGVLRMPYEMAMGDELSRIQFYSRAQQALDELTSALALAAEREGEIAQIGDALDLPEASGPIRERITWLIQREESQRKRAAAANARAEAMSFALTESVRLQSHYALLLNQYDGGSMRKGFANAQEWIDRLAAIAAAQS